MQEAREQQYRNSLDHILDELNLLDLHLARAVFKFRILKRDEEWNEYSGLYITDNEIDNTLSLPVNRDTSVKYPENLTESIEKSKQTIKSKIESALKIGTDLELIRLSRRFGLSSFETDVILCCLAPEINSKYERIYAYLHNDVTKKNLPWG